VPLLLLVLLIWASYLPVVKIAVRELPPLAYVTLRCLVASAFLVWLTRRREAGLPPLPTRRLRAGVAFLGVTGFLVSTALNNVGLKYTTGTNAAIIQASTPILITLLARPVLGERLSARKLGGIGVSVLGVLVIVSKGHWRVLWEARWNGGDPIIIAGLVGWALYTIYGQRVMRHLTPLAATTYSYLVGTACLIPVALVEWPWAALASASWRPWAGLAYQGILGSLAHLWYYEVVRTLGPAGTAPYLNLNPPLGVAMSALTLGEAITAAHLVGGALVLLGIAIARR
jgi:drug/metabolite transporter (DMT)-like permease